jgi:signal transduction histidine kinase
MAIRVSIENSLVELSTISPPNTIIEDLNNSLSSLNNIVSEVEKIRNLANKPSEELISEVNLKAVAERIVNLMKENAQRARVDLRLNDMEKLPTVYSNEQDIEQLFIALVENALQAADRKKNHRLVISGDVKDKQIELRFADTCGGVAKKNLDKIFEPFFTTRPPGEGTGLGLYIVENIVSKAGGKVRVESKAGKGSTFFITLPINT